MFRTEREPNGTNWVRVKIEAEGGVARLKPFYPLPLLHNASVFVGNGL